MLKSELLAKLAERKDIKLVTAETAVELVFNAIIESLSQGDRVEIRGFGVFVSRDYKSYQGRNPRTGESITVAAKRLPFWKTGVSLKQRVDAAFLGND